MENRAGRSSYGCRPYRHKQRGSPHQLGSAGRQSRDYTGRCIPKEPEGERIAPRIPDKWQGAMRATLSLSA